jgi:hypothetical protein
MAARTPVRFTSRLSLSLPVAIAKMKAGSALRFENRQGKSIWSIDGASVSATVATSLLAWREIEPDSDTLFDGVNAQTWRFLA